MDINYSHKISVEEFNGLRKLVGWNIVEHKLAENTIKNAMFIITAVYNNETIGMGRVCGDGGYTVIITDVIVNPEYQGKGIGKKLMQEIMKFIENNLEEGQEVFVNLMAAKNKEFFYKQFGFEERPNEKVGAGMSQMIKYQGKNG